ncbi:PIN domain-containing protein [Shewanella algae]
MTTEFSKKEVYPSPEKAFSFFLSPIEEIKKDCIFLLDANVLLLPFTTDVKNLEAIKSIYKKLVEADRLFLPAQAVREYLDNRAKKLSDINEALYKKSNQSFQYVGEHPLLNDLDKYKEVIEQEGILKEAIKKYQNKIRETLEAVQAWGWNDPVSKMYHEVLSDRVLKDDDLKLEEISKDLKRRNELNIPPGYKDKSKQDNAAGDLLIWHELLNLAESKKKHVIFVSGDEKADWWHQSGKNPLYPRFELVDEFRERTEGKSFHIISLSGLLALFDASKEAVEDIRESEKNKRTKNTRYSLDDIKLVRRFLSENSDLFTYIFYEYDDLGFKLHDQYLEILGHYRDHWHTSNLRSFDLDIRSIQDELINQLVALRNIYDINMYDGVNDYIRFDTSRYSKSALESKKKSAKNCVDNIAVLYKQLESIATEKI